MNTPPDHSRRRFVTGLLGLSVLAPPLVRATLPTTPRQTAGPFYPEHIPLDDDSDLTSVRGHASVATGEITDLGGRILDVNGQPLPRVRIEIWQCDANGRYRHSRDPGRAAMDENFQGHGHAITNGAGRYRFRTIRPVPYPGRCPHIHIAVFAPGTEPFVTQLYVRGDPRNDQDFLYRAVPADRRELVTAVFEPGAMQGIDWRASFDIILASDNGTPRS